MRVWLLRSGIEWNPGPKRKPMKHCSTCGRFVLNLCATCEPTAPKKVFAADHEPTCSSSTSTLHGNDLSIIDNNQMVEQMALYTVASDQVLIHAATFQQLQTAGNVFGFYNSPAKTVVINADPILSHNAVKKLHNVGGFGACLFNALSFALYGNEKASLIIRHKICENMITINFPPDKLFANGSLCQTVEEYLLTTDMRNPSTYGGDVEISTFVHLTKIAVVLYVQSISSWVLYSDPKPQNQLILPQIYLFLDGNHFQFVAEMTVSTSYQLPILARRMDNAHSTGTNLRSTAQRPSQREQEQQSAVGTAHQH